MLDDEDGYTWLLADAQHSVRLTRHRDPARAAKRHHYYPFGDPVTTGPPATPGNYGYLNKPHDPTGEVRLDHRNYTPTLNQLTTPDPLLNAADPQSFNPYAYSRNNPIAMQDPSGLLALEQIEGGGGGGGGAGIGLPLATMIADIVGVGTVAEIFADEPEATPVAPFVHKVANAALLAAMCTPDCGDSSGELELDNGQAPSHGNLAQLDAATNGQPPRKPPGGQTSTGFPDDDGPGDDDPADSEGIPAGSTADAETSGGRITSSVRRNYFQDGAEPPMCSYCRQNPAEHLDHVIPRSQGGDLTAVGFPS